MMNALISAFVITCCVSSVFGQFAVNNTGKLKCRRCNNALTLDDCINQVFCEPNEECYMDELITEQLSVIYNGGCRPKEVCASGNSGHLGRRKRQVLVACSRCCSRGDDCNKRLCGIKSLALNSSQCYSCERNSDQSQVTKPEDCVTLATCQSDEVCYAGLNNVGGNEQFLYGCKSKAWCRLLMDREFAALKECETNPELCGDISRRSGTAVCHSCCGDGGCNYGSCIAMNQRLYNLYKNKVFDPISMTQTGKLPASTVAPAATQPPTAAPAPTQPPTAAPAPTQPPTAAPAPTQPSTAAPAPTQPSTAPPAPTQPSTAAPAPTQPSTAAPAPTQPSTAAPAPTQPSTAAPAPTQPPTSASPVVAASSGAPSSAAPSAPPAPAVG